MSSDVALRVSGASKHYLIYRRPEDRLKQMVVPKLRRFFGLPPQTFYTDFSAVNGIDLTVKRGETVGIIGRNGSGKSTLLQMICGTLQPTSGLITVNGRIAALLELGAGFNPEFTGRENVKLNCAILGLTPQETEARFEAIERFADIGIFIDQPVKTYSSGMYVRLAFAVAINVDPDVLVVDEALAVGDEAFQRKCYARIEQIRERGATILFVSHGAQTIIQLCDRAILMDRGEILMDGSPKSVVQQYQRFINASAETQHEVRAAILELKEHQTQNSAEAFDSKEESNRDKELRGLMEGLDIPGQPEGTAERRSSWEITSANDRSLQEEASFQQGIQTQSAVYLEERGAVIRDVRIMTADDRRVNVLITGEEYSYCYDVDFHTSASSIAFAMYVKLPNGLGVGGASSNISPTTRLPEVREGDRYSVRIKFVCNFARGTYFANAGVFGVKDGESYFLHRIMDAIAFRVDAPPFSLSLGPADLAPSLSISRLNE